MTILLVDFYEKSMYKSIFFHVLVQLFSPNDEFSQASVYDKSLHSRLVGLIADYVNYMRIKSESCNVMQCHNTTIMETNPAILLYEQHRNSYRGGRLQLQCP